MDQSTDFEMPSPKRMRLYASEHKANIDPATPADDIDDLYGSPLVQPESPMRGSQVPAPAPDILTPSTNQKLFQLPGLGTLDGDPTSSSQTLQKQSETSSFPEAGLKSPSADMEDIELEDGQKSHADRGLDVALDHEEMVDVQITEPEIISPVSGETLVERNPTIITKHEIPSPETQIPVDQGLTRSGSKPVQARLEWHSSGTILDTRMWLGFDAIDKATSMGPESVTASANTNAEDLEDADISQASDSTQEQLGTGASPIAARNEKMTSVEPNFDNNIDEAEFELDSSPLGSDSSSDDSTDNSSSDDSDADDYEMLSPAEQARRLMAEDGGSDDDGKGKGRKAIVEIPRTLNEKPDEWVPKPNIIVTADMKIEELGIVENTVENLVLIKANTSGEYEVLESGSLLCLEDRSVIGIISETLGRVQQPYYCVRFTNAKAIAEAGVEKGTKTFYVAQHSTTVFTQPLKAFKGSDASNLHDEEVGDDELEFSDDEAEAEHKRQIRQNRMAKRNAKDGQPDGFSRGPQQRPGGHGTRLGGGLHPSQEQPPNSAEAALNYDDAGVPKVAEKEDDDGLYTPLARPSNLHEILSGKSPPSEGSGGLRNNNRGRGDSKGGNRSRGGSRGRGGNRGMRDIQRGGGKQNWKDHGNRGGKGQAYGQSIPPTPQTNGFSPSQRNGLPPRPATENSGHQRSIHRGDGYSHLPTPHSPNPSPSYHRQQQPPQFQPQPTYPPQYHNVYTQTQVPHPPHQSYPADVPQHNYYQYAQPPQQQPISHHHGYMPPPPPPPQFASRPDMSSAPRPPQYPPSIIPPGAHINPNLFKQQHAHSSAPQDWRLGYSQQQQQLASPASNRMGPPAPASDTARLQELLRGLGKGAGQS